MIIIPQIQLNANQASEFYCSVTATINSVAVNAQVREENNISATAAIQPVSVSATITNTFTVVTADISASVQSVTVSANVTSYNSVSISATVQPVNVSALMESNNYVDVSALVDPVSVYSEIVNNSDDITLDVTATVESVSVSTTVELENVFQADCTIQPVSVSAIIVNYAGNEIDVSAQVRSVTVSARVTAVRESQLFSFSAMPFFNSKFAQSAVYYQFGGDPGGITTRVVITNKDRKQFAYNKSDVNQVFYPIEVLVNRNDVSEITVKKDYISIPRNYQGDEQVIHIQEISPDSTEKMWVLGAS